MATNSFEKETLAAVYTLLNGDTELTTATGVNPQTGGARSVPVYNQVPQNTPVPYVRVTLTDTIPLSDEPFTFGSVAAKTVSLMVSAFSDYEPEVFGIASRIEALLENTQVSTTHFSGAAWHRGTTFFTDNTSVPDKVLRCASSRIRVNLTAS